MRELSRQGIPDLNATLPKPNPNYESLGLLTDRLKGAVLLGHSQAGTYPLEAALLKPDSVKAMILVEPGSCNAESWSQDQIKTLAKIPLLVVYGDHLSAPTFVPGPGWQARFDGCQTLISRLRREGGTAEMLHPPELGIYGNSHLIMQDKNNLQIADLVLEWLARTVDAQDAAPAQP
ncbi:hypothetical protein FYK61_11630 [Xanthomonas citri]|uniref:hypothetical protein n=1 Tax=Xanthomonas citri TaxID=346 RepID=UPI0018858679|nr:hypothetical protein [Xanthomonas citri]MBE2321134.1 hypothetical protein [Solirubrobacter deserti]QOY21992.1 hypothetical protein FYK61_11630 [Xanthomonas citri]QQK68134.1 hypothetical protein G3566_11615 [Xanthomonas citri]